jgi:hypothetical protein
MSRNRDRWGDDDDSEPRRPPRSNNGMSPVAIVLIVVGCLVGLGVLACGGLMLIGFRTAKQEEARMEAEAEAEHAQNQRQFDDARRAAEQHFGPMPRELPDQQPVADVPPPKAGFDEAPEPPPQPKATTFATDDPAHPDHWRVLYRSKKPQFWNTNTQDGDDFAIPIRSTPEKTKYLRLRRMDTGDAIIIPMTRGRVGRADQPGPKVRWSGRGEDEHGGYHLGIAEGPVAKFTEGKGTIGVLMDGWAANPGSGFGHAHHIDNGGQRYSWMGKEIPATVFEIAVTTESLTDSEKKWLRK